MHIDRRVHTTCATRRSARTSARRAGAHLAMRHKKRTRPSRRWETHWRGGTYGVAARLQPSPFIGGGGRRRRTSRAPGADAQHGQIHGAARREDEGALVRRGGEARADAARALGAREGRRRVCPFWDRCAGRPRATTRSTAASSAAPAATMSSKRTTSAPAASQWSWNAPRTAHARARGASQRAGSRRRLVVRSWDRVARKCHILSIASKGLRAQ